LRREQRHDAIAIVERDESFAVELSEIDLPLNEAEERIERIWITEHADPQLVRDAPTGSADFRTRYENDQ
jgi:hypothetical protein